MLAENGDFRYGIVTIRRERELMLAPPSWRARSAGTVRGATGSDRDSLPSTFARRRPRQWHSPGTRTARRIRVIDIALLATFRGRSVGTQLFGELQREAAAAGKPLRTHVERFNPALNLYVRLEFRLIEDRGVYLFLEWSPDGGSSTPPSVQPDAQENTAS